MEKPDVKLIECPRDAMQGIVFDWNTQTNYVYRSVGVQRYLGYQTDEIQPHVDWWINLIHPEDRETTVQYMRNFVAGKELHGNVNYRVRHRAGHYGCYTESRAAWGCK